VCRVCVAPAFFAFYAFCALLKSVSYGNTEGLKVQVPPPALPTYINQAMTESTCIPCGGQGRNAGRAGFLATELEQD
jgi:hypothetical protein